MYKQLGKIQKKRTEDSFVLAVVCWCQLQKKKPKTETREVHTTIERTNLSPSRKCCWQFIWNGKQLPQLKMMSRQKIAIQFQYGKQMNIKKKHYIKQRKTIFLLRKNCVEWNMQRKHLQTLWWPINWLKYVLSMNGSSAYCIKWELLLWNCIKDISGILKRWRMNLFIKMYYCY